MIAKVGIPFENLWVLLNDHRRQKYKKTYTTYNRSHNSKVGKIIMKKWQKVSGNWVLPVWKTSSLPPLPQDSRLMKALK
jgi:hypothetical protein